MLAGSEYFVLDSPDLIQGLSAPALDRVYVDFKRYVAREIADDAFLSKSPADGYGYGKQLSDLEKDLLASGLPEAAKEASLIREKARKELLRDMDSKAHRRSIQEDLLFAIASRALPDRVLIDRTVRLDPQVSKALELVRNPNSYYETLFSGAIDAKGNDGPTSSMY